MFTNFPVVLTFYCYNNKILAHNVISFVNKRTWRFLLLDENFYKTLHNAETTQATAGKDVQLPSEQEANEQKEGEDWKYRLVSDILIFQIYSVAITPPYFQ